MLTALSKVIDNTEYERIGALNDGARAALKCFKHICGCADYIGCMKNGPVYSDKKYRWHERQWPLLGGNYFTHAWGTLYVLSGRIARQIGDIPDGSLRFFSNEGVEAAFLWQD